MGRILVEVFARESPLSERRLPEYPPAKETAVVVAEFVRVELPAALTAAG